MSVLGVLASLRGRLPSFGRGSSRSPDYEAARLIAGIAGVDGAGEPEAAA